VWCLGLGVAAGEGGGRRGVGSVAGGGGGDPQLHDRIQCHTSSCVSYRCVANKEVFSAAACAVEGGLGGVWGGGVD
jgi:hypothetical protein